MKLTPPETKGASSVVRIADDWYIACRSSEIGEAPIARTILGIPMVLFRDGEGQVGALLDRCPHRNVPLSLGCVAFGELQCGYHGWRFDRQGDCRFIPALREQSAQKTRRVDAFPVREQDGYIWVYPTANAEPEREPFRIPHLGSPGYANVHEQVDARGTLHATAENALDVPHTAFLHGGLFRTPDRRQPIDVVVRRWHDRVEAEYIGEERPTGIAGRIVAPGGGTVTHYDRFFLPCIVQVDYRIGEHTHFCITSALTPVGDFHTRLFASISFKLPIPPRLVAPVLRPFAMRIFRQDAEVLARQTETIEHFGGEQFMSTEVDVLGPHILRLLRQAEQGERTPVAEPTVRKLQMVT